MKTINVILADDHAPSRKLLRRLIEFLPDFDIVGETANGEDLVNKVLALDPHLVLADINMPGLNGIDAVKECIKLKPDLKFIFVTAYDDYAVEAFNMYAIDYVKKPVVKNRLFLALERAKQSRGIESLDVGPTHHKQVIPIHFNRSIYYVPLNDILFIEKVDRKSIIYTKDQDFQTYETLEALMKSLNDSFYQTHRSYIVNIVNIYRITSSGNTFLAHFKNFNRTAFISKQKIRDLRHILEERMILSG